MIWGVPWPYFILALIVGLLSAARLTRLVVNDHWPPIDWLKSKWDERMVDSSWWILLSCPWCFAPWVTLIVGLWAMLSNLHWSWWLFNGWMGGAYVVSWLVFHDEDGSSDEG